VLSTAIPRAADVQAVVEQIVGRGQWVDDVWV
jgi:hypothetical protein